MRKREGQTENRGQRSAVSDQSAVHADSAWTKQKPRQWRGFFAAPNLRDQWAVVLGAVLWAGADGMGAEADAGCSGAGMPDLVL